MLPFVALAAFSAIKAVATVSAANSQIKAITRQQEEIARIVEKNAASQVEALETEGKLVAKEKARQVSLKASVQRVSFLNAGLTLEGTPRAAIENTFNIGMEDVRQIGINYATRARNISDEIIGRARMQNMELRNRALSISNEAKMGVLNTVGDLAMQGFQSGMFSAPSAPSVPVLKPAR